VHGLRYALLIPLYFALFGKGRTKAQATAAWVLGPLIVFHVLLLQLLYWMARYVADRHVFPVVALALPWVASGTFYVAERLRPIFAQSHGLAPLSRPGRILALLILSLTLSLVPRSLRPVNADRLELLRGAECVRARARPGDAVLSNSAHVLFYSGAPGQVMKSSNGIPEAALRDGSPYRFVVLQANSPNFNPAWISQLASRYGQLDAGQECDLAPSILVMQARQP
jgi:hypothetical protein